MIDMSRVSGGKNIAVGEASTIGASETHGIGVFPHPLRRAAVAKRSGKAGKGTLQRSAAAGCAWRSPPSLCEGSKSFLFWQRLAADAVAINQTNQRGEIGTLAAVEDGGTAK